MNQWQKPILKKWQLEARGRIAQGTADKRCERCRKATATVGRRIGEFWQLWRLCEACSEKEDPAS